MSNPANQADSARSAGPKDPALRQLRSLIDVTERSNSDLTQIIARDAEERVLGVAVVARGGYAAPLVAYLKRLSDEEDRARRRRKA